MYPLFLPFLWSDRFSSSLDVVKKQTKPLFDIQGTLSLLSCSGTGRVPTFPGAWGPHRLPGAGPTRTVVGSQNLWSPLGFPHSRESSVSRAVRWRWVTQTHPSRSGKRREASGGAGLFRSRRVLSSRRQNRDQKPVGGDRERKPGLTGKQAP